MEQVHERDFDLNGYLKESMTGVDYPETALFVAHFRETFGDALLAVIFYGSCLNDSTRSDTSFLDFFLIADNYDDFHKKWLHRKANRTMPPAIFYLELKNDAGQTVNCKYCVISLEDLQESTGNRAKDFYHLGRFSKRTAVLYAPDEWVVDDIVSCTVNAWEALTPYALTLCSNTFSVSDFAKKILAISYLGEVRLEETDKKVEALYQAASDHYDTMARTIIRSYIQWNRDEFQVDEELKSQGKFYQRRTPVQRALKTAQLDKALAKSKRRAKLRWPFLMLTVQGWVDILLAKLERTYGVKLELSPFERRFILIFGWRHYFRLRKEGKVK